MHFGVCSYTCSIFLRGDDFIVNAYEVWFSNLKISNKEKIKILDLYCPEEIWNMSKNELQEINLNENDLREILNNENKLKLKQYLNYI